MIRILISIVFFYLSGAIVIGTIADLRLNPAAHPTLSGRFKTLMQFFSFAFVFLAIGWFVWPDRDMVTYPRYYIGQMVKSTKGASFKVRIKQRLDGEDLFIILSKIKRDSSQLNCTAMYFYLPEQTYNSQPYAEYTSTTDDVWHKVANLFNYGANEIVMRGEN